MNISALSNSDYNVSMQGIRDYTNAAKRTAQKIYNKIPLFTLNDGEKQVRLCDKANYKIAHPLWNRGIIGATALISQPAIDYYNHRVDEETRTVSRNRTIAKIVVGTLVGMLVVRGPVYKMVDKMTRIDDKSKYCKMLLTKSIIKGIKQNPDSLNNYKIALSTILALGIMSITNFLLDAPLTNLFTNYLNKKSGIKPQKEKTTEVKDVQ